MTESSVIIAGFGGQGILLAGEVLANALMLDGKDVTWYPCYGAEMRGGTVNCEVVASDDEVSSVNKKEADFIIALNQLSFEKFLPKLKKGGWIIANSSLVKELRSRIDVNYFFAPITHLANELGEIRISNIISLGILSKIGKLTSIETLHKALDMVLPEHKKNLLPLNLEALETGFNLQPVPVTVG
ncbi:MAG: 2-oxoacid:acceptor oxidoreductase family protein [Candidatus Gastranaerophilales bacterium]|nr:2-oxoacid:acceptor oxidoreductase family protein [Candidatus Gastranaerophilales bacterium]